MQVKGTRLWWMLVEYVEDNNFMILAIISLVHVRNLHPGANLHRDYFWSCEWCFKKLHPGENLHPMQIFPTLEVVQIYLHPGANLLPGANCAHKRKMFNFFTF